MKDVGTVVLAIIGAVALLVALSAVMALPVMWLWNGLVPDLFHGPTLTFMQAWGLQILCGSLFGRVSTK